ncbi:MAG: SMC family ATPase, partial [Actinobacteria bacterium]|nr:SMC family ATPase [Actinomycetota bacterium]MCI0678018.1 SMC family ATPase [Actinomycetota bacterium]
LALQERVLEESAVLTVEIDTETSNAAVAAGLATHLRADGFERWMMAGALHTLVVGANDLLAQLSDGGYSLHSEEGSFTVVDHRNADERRSVSTLSGGETFLVSLALALSLAETLASGGGARLDAIILDEGFGTLDDESLDTVATVLEELAGHGLMVGVITHVKELASRAPTRFEVTRGARGSTVKEMA